MFCPSCGRELDENTKFCPGCGRQIENEYENVKEESIIINEDPNQNTAKCFKVFNKIGKILGIVAIATCWIPLFGTVAGVPGIVFSCLGKRWKGDEARANSKKGLTLSIVGSIISFVVYIIAVVIIVVAGLIAELS